MTYGGAILLAGLLVGVAVIGSPARAQTAPATADECLAKPNAPSPRGSHWYYRIDRANNRHCWYLRPVPSNAGQNETTQTRASVTPTARPSVTAPANPPLLDTPPDPPATGARNISRNASPPAIWPASPPAFAPPAPIAPATAVEGEPTQAADSVAAPTPIPLLRDPKIDAPNPNREAKSAKRTAAAPTDRPVLPVEEPTHMPALLGIGLALALIMFGSFGARLIFKYLGRARRRIGRAPLGSNWDAPSFHVDDAPGIVPGLRRRPDITRDPHDLADPRTQPNRSAKTPQGLDAVGIIEANVRDLLVRLRSEPQAAPARPEDGRSRPRDGR
jgi:hypothetical protein